eukprot:CAMPEP_0117518112 /NCGR_PEP_ID=MMETSP0784-20121206/31964_1 /TAXON_ID=39447 /ORGANISM="" /LENGTH=235 /DNA_ID=CAMNT_0005314023 /DNA_START=121 /DNA_END=828 /DNA_ORIENTATION=+
MNCFALTAHDIGDNLEMDPLRPESPGKENMGHAVLFLEAAALEQDYQRRKDDEERQRGLLEDHEHQRMLAEAARREAEEVEEAEEAERMNKEEVERRREAEAQAEVDAQAKAEAEATKRRDKAALDAFLKRYRYKGVNQKRETTPRLSYPLRTARRAKYPLHTAVKHKNEDMVRILLEAGANPRMTDSNNLTARQLAGKMNSDGSLDGIQTRLSETCAVQQRRRYIAASGYVVLS